MTTTIKTSNITDGSITAAKLSTTAITDKLGFTPLANNAASLTANKLTTARTISVGGDASGSVSFDGSEDVVLNIAVGSNSVVLGTDTVGDYLASISSPLATLSVMGSGESAAVTVDLPNTGVNAGTYGSSTQLASVTVDAQGRITSASQNSLSTSNVTEGTNLYYTTARFDTALATKSTTNLAEGTNLYYTDARVGTYLSTNSYATQTYVNTAISNLVDSAPTTLDTLNELAAALGDDANFSTTVTTALGNKFNTSDFNTTFDTRLTAKYNEGTANGVVFLNGSKAFTTGTALTFDGTNFGIGNTTPWSKLWVERNGINLSTFSFEDASSTAHLTLAGQDANVRLHFGTLNVEPYAGYIQTGYDNTPDATGTGASGTNPLLLNPLGGNVGIGTSLPSTKLHVYETGAADAVLRLTPADGSYDALFQMTGQGNNIATEGFEVWYNNSVGDVHLSTTFANDASAIRFHTRTGASKSTTNERLTILGNGNVGVGTTNPTNILTISNGGAVGLEIQPTGGYTGLGGIDFLAYNRNASVYAPIGFITNSSNNSMVILTNGNVGIGIVNPSALLHAKKTSGNAAIYADYNGTNIVRLEAAANGNGYIGIASGGGTLSIGTAGAPELVHLRTNGTVSIGTTTDRGGMLQVEGTARAHAYRYVPGLSPHGITGDILMHHTNLRMFNGTALYKVENTENGGSSWSDVTSSGIDSFKFVFNRQPRAARYGGFAISPKANNHIGGGRRFTFAVGYCSWMGWVHSGSANGTTIRLIIEALNSDESLRYTILDTTYGGYPDDHTFPLDPNLDSGTTRIRVTYIILSQGGIPSQPDNNASVGCGVMLSTYSGQWINNEIDDRDGAMVVANRLALSDYADKRVQDVGIGVSFPNAQRASADPNTLDDYEEGEFTNSVNVVGGDSAGTITLVRKTCTYTKVGRIVICHLNLGWNSFTGSGELRITGLPFPVSSNFAYTAGGVLSWNSGLNITAGIGATNASLWSDVSGTIIRCWAYTSSGSGSPISSAANSSVAEIHIKYIYETNT